MAIRINPQLKKINVLKEFVSQGKTTEIQKFLAPYRDSTKLLNEFGDDAKKLSELLEAIISNSQTNQMGSIQPNVDEAIATIDKLNKELHVLKSNKLLQESWL